MTDEKITFLRIEHYSSHPEVAKAADLLVQELATSKEFLKDRSAWTSAARKLVASMWIRKDDSFRFGTKNDYYSRGKRKQVWMTPKTLKLFRVALKLEWIVKTKAEIRPKYSTKRNGGMTSVYQRTPAFLNLLKSLAVKDLEPDKDLPWVILKDDEGNILDLPSGYLLSHSHRRTVSVLIKHYNLLINNSIYQLIDSNPSPVDTIDIRYTRQWKVNTGIGGRFYSAFCNYSKKERLSITIN